MKKPIVLAIVGIGAYLLWKKSQGTVNGLGASPFSDLSGLGRFSVKRAVSSVVSVASAPIQAAATPLRVMAAPITGATAALKVVAEGGSLKQVTAAANTTIRKEMMTPLTVPVKALQPVMTKSMSQKVSNLGSKPGLRVALGRPKPGTNTPTAVVSGASLGPTVSDSAAWSPVSGKAGWEYTIGSDGSTVFRNLSSGSSFYCTTADMSSIGTLDAAINLFLYGNPYGPFGDPNMVQRNTTVATDPVLMPGPDTSSMPGSSGSSFVPSYSGQSYSAGQSVDPSQPSADGSQVMQQYQSADAVAPAAAGKINPLVVAGTFIAVPLAFMLTKGK